MISTLIIGVCIGLLLGLTGAGGSVLALPLLMNGAQLNAQTAAGFSLGAVAIAALIGVLLRIHWRLKKTSPIVWSAAFLLAVGGAVAAPLGQLLARRMPPLFILCAYTVLVFFIAYRLWQQASKNPEATRVLRAGNVSEDFSTPVCALSSSGFFEWKLPCVSRLFGVGMITGVLSGFFGVGGGFVIVPALVLLIGLSMAQAVATSLVIISVISSVGFISFLLQKNTVLTALPMLAMGSVLGMVLGTVLAPRLAGPLLQKFFVAMMLILSAWMWLKI